MDGLNYLLPWTTTVYIYRIIEIIEPILDHTDEAQYIQEIEFLLLWATTESNMADILNIEKNTID